MSEEDCRASDIVDDVYEQLQYSMTNEKFSMSEDENELLQILSNFHFRALGVCFQEIASGNFFAPTLPSTDTYIPDGTVNNLSQEVYNNSFRGIYSSTFRNVHNGDAVKKSASLNTSLGEVVSSISSSSGGVKLTGGGEGLPMKPVDEDELRLISFQRNIEEDLVSFSLCVPHQNISIRLMSSHSITSRALQ